MRSSNANGLSVDYTYDALNRLDTVKDNNLGALNGGTTTYSYDTVGNLQSYLYPNGVTTTYNYNSQNRVASMSANTPVSTLASYSYTLGAAGNRTAVTELSGRTVDYTYDDLYRLTNETIANDPHVISGTISYSYDSVGNRLSRTSSVAGVPSQNSTYDTNDSLTSDTYDANGNTKVSGGASYEYDFENRLITHTSSNTSGFVYDGDGNRVAKTVDRVTTNYLDDTNNHTGYAQVVEELQSGAVVKQFTYGHDLISQRFVEGGLSFYGHDGHGSVRWLTDATATLTDTYDYDAFGSLISRSGITPNDYLYSGEQFDANLGFYSLRARYMNPSTGTFLTMDSYEGSLYDPISLHKHLYADANPVNRSDPSGNFSIPEAIQTLQLASLRVFNFIQFSRTVQLVKYGLQLANLAGMIFSENYRGETLAFGPEAATLVFDDLFEVVGSAKAGISSYQELLQLRQGYETEVRGLQSFLDELRAAGRTISEIAKEMTTARRLIGMRYKDVSPPRMREAIFARNMEKFQDPLGPSYEYFRNVRKYTDEQIIQSSMKPDGKDFWWIRIARKLGVL